MQRQHIGKAEMSGFWRSHGLAGRLLAPEISVGGLVLLPRAQDCFAKVVRKAWLNVERLNLNSDQLTLSQVLALDLCAWNRDDVAVADLPELLPYQCRGLVYFVYTVYERGPLQRFRRTFERSAR